MEFLTPDSHYSLNDSYGGVFQSVYKSKVGKEPFTETNRGYVEFSDEYVKFINEYINYVFDVPLKNQIENNAIKELFNRAYYDYLELGICLDDKKYGRQSCFTSKDGVKKYSKIVFSRGEDGEVTIGRY